MTPWESIRLAGAAMSPGACVRGVCPFCHGGRNKEESFVLERRGNDLRYHCYRASCDGRSKGVLSISGDPTRIAPVKEKEKEHVLRAPTYNLSQTLRYELRDKYQLTGPVIDYYGLSQSKEGDIIIPIYNSRGIVQGHERKVREPGKAKAIRYNGLDADGMGWYNTKPTYHLPDEYVSATHRRRAYIDRCVFVVEDLYSAIKANAFIHSLALLGTGLSPEKAAALAQARYENVFLALDKDATAKAAAMCRRYRAVLPNMTLVSLEKDIKNTRYADIARIIYDAYDRTRGTHQ